MGAAGDKKPAAAVAMGGAQRDDALFRASWKPSDLKARSLDSTLHDGSGASADNEGENGMSAAEQAIRAIEAQRESASVPTPSKLSGSLGSLKLSESFGAMP